MANRSRISEPVKAALLAALRAQLAQAEHLAWAESPDPDVFELEKPGLSRTESVSIIVGGYALLGSMVMAVRAEQWLWLLVPVALLACGIAWYSVVRWTKLRATKTLEGTIYGFTTRRALIVRTYPALAVQVLPIEAVTEVTLRNERGDLADLALKAASTSESLVFERISEPERARTQILRVLRDPKGTEQEIAASEAYALQMRQLMVRSMPS